MALASGDSLGRYTVERLLGSGAMGEVHLARDPRIDRKVALKTLRLATRGFENSVRPGDMEAMSERLLREARAAGRLIHPNIVTLFDAGEDDGLLYLAFEYVPGSDLAARLQAGPPLPLGEALRIAGETCEGLDHAHRQGIVHRDVKPSNLMLAADGRVKISDFGIAKLAGEAQELTVSGTVMGSPHYLSPEQVRGEGLDGRSDLFSVGIVLYEMIAGRRPFAGETLTTLVYQILHQEAPALPPLRSGLAPAVPQLLARFLAKDRDLRMPDARTAVEALAGLAAALPRELLALPAVSHDEGTLLLDESEVTSARLPPPPQPTAPAGGGQGVGSAPGSGPAVGDLGAAGWAAAGRGADATGGRAASFATPAAAEGFGELPVPAPTVDHDGFRTGEALAGREMPAGAGVAAGGPHSGSYAIPARNLRHGAIWAVAAGVVVLAVLALGFLFLRSGGAATASLGAGAGEPPSPVEERPAETDPAGGAPLAARAADAAGAAGDDDPDEAGAAKALGAQHAASEPPSPAASARDRSGLPATVPPPRAPSAGGVSAVAPGGAAPPRRDVPLADSPNGASEPRPSTAAAPPAAALDAATDEAAPPAPPDTSAGRRRAIGRPRSLGAAESADEAIASGMRLVFRVQPDDAYVLLDGIVVGQARDFSPASRRPLDLPSAGVHTVVLRRAGMADRTIRVDARADGPAVTPLVGRLLPVAAGETPLHELETHRVGKAIGLRVTPAAARVLVDGRDVGAAGDFGGGRMGRGSWLELPPGMHRVSLVAPGHRRVDLAVDVTSGALEERKRIQVALAPLPSGAGP
jgi:eukaryotic-like serine/threonine-protein kinase